MTFDEAFAAMPLIAILRGLDPARAEAVGDILFGAGFRLIEVPLNSPEPYQSIGILAKRLAGRAVVGAGTVLSATQAERVAASDGGLVVAPNLDLEVGEAAARQKLPWCPGVMTPTEAFAAVRAGASALKMFPAELVPPAAVGALRAVLPSTTRLVMVGGIRPESMRPYRKAGAHGFGLGSALFKPGMSDEEISEAAEAFAAEWRALSAAGE